MLTKEHFKMISFLFFSLHARSVLVRSSLLKDYEESSVGLQLDQHHCAPCKNLRFFTNRLIFTFGSGKTDCWNEIEKTYCFSNSRPKWSLWHGLVIADEKEQFFILDVASCLRQRDTIFPPWDAMSPSITYLNQPTKNTHPPIIHQPKQPTHPHLPTHRNHSKMPRTYLSIHCKKIE